MEDSREPVPRTRNNIHPSTFWGARSEWGNKNPKNKSGEPVLHQDNDKNKQTQIVPKARGNKEIARTTTKQQRKRKQFEEKRWIRTHTP